MRFTSTLAFAAGVSAQNYLGFNSGSTKTDKSAKFKADWVQEFTTARGLKNAPGTFDSVRLYTNIQAYSEDDPIEAFDAAVETKTNILLGIWTSGTTSIDKELSALNKAVLKHGQNFIDLVVGISIGSEDLYRVSVTGIANKAGVGNGPDEIVNFINQYKKAFADSPLGTKPVGHVDTWDVWGNATNKPVLDAVDWIGVDEYPYYESGKGNDIKNAPELFDRAYDAALAAAGGKPVWLTETGWPTTGINWDLGVPSVQNAKYYWDEVGCRRLFGKTPTFWYTLRDSNPDNKQQFAITDNLSTDPFFDLSCPTTFDTPNSTVSSTAGTASATGGAGSSGSGSGSGSGAGSNGGGSGSGAAAGASGSAVTKPNAGGQVSQMSSGVYFAGLVFVAGLVALF